MRFGIPEITVLLALRRVNLQWSFRESLNVPLGVHLTTALGFVYTFLNCIERIFCVYIFLPSLVIHFAPSLVIIVIIWLDAFAYAFCQNILMLLLFSLVYAFYFLSTCMLIFFLFIWLRSNSTSSNLISQVVQCFHLKC